MKGRMLTATIALVPVVVAACVVAACGESSRPSGGRATADATCDGCAQIRIASVVTLGESARSGTARAPDLARVAEDGSIWTVRGRDVEVCDRAGAPVRAFARAFISDDDAADSSAIRSIADLTFAGADSVLVVDSAAHRLVVLDRGGDALRHVLLPSAARIRAAVVVDWPDRVVVAGRVGAGSGVFAASVRGDHVVVRRDSYSAAEPPASHRYHLPPRFNGPVWAIDDAGTLSRWDETGRVRTQVGRVRGGNAIGASIGRGSARRSARIHAVSEDSDGRLWVYSRVATEAAPSAWRSLEARRAGGRIEAGMERLYHTQVHVLEPMSMRVLGRGLIRAWLVSAVSGSSAVFRADGADGMPVTRVYELVLDDAP
jgi:hypothetical protein